MERIYLDFNATTPVHPTVAEAMKPYLEEYFGIHQANIGLGHNQKQELKKHESKLHHC